MAAIHLHLAFAIFHLIPRLLGNEIERNPPGSGELTCPPGYLVFGQRAYTSHLGSTSRKSPFHPALTRFQFCIQCRHDSRFLSDLEVCSDHGLWSGLDWRPFKSPSERGAPRDSSGSNDHDHSFVASEPGYLERISSSCSNYEHVLASAWLGPQLECRKTSAGVRFLGPIRNLGDLARNVEWITTHQTQSLARPWPESDVICHQGTLKGIVLTFYDSVIEGKHFGRSCSLCPNHRHTCRIEYNPIEEDYKTYYKCLEEPCWNGTHRGPLNESHDAQAWCGFRSNGEYGNLPRFIGSLSLLACQSGPDEVALDGGLDALHGALMGASLLGLVFFILFILQVAQRRHTTAHHSRTYPNHQCSES